MASVAVPSECSVREALQRTGSPAANWEEKLRVGRSAGPLQKPGKPKEIFPSE